MANSSTGGPQRRNSVKAPLIFSAVLALIAGIATMIFATGGAEQELRFDLGLIAVGIAFIASLLVSSLLLMTEKPNPEHLSQGSGVHRSSAKIPGGAGNVGKPTPPATDQDDSPRPADPTA
ncbi:hypothetical protein [Arthrobacter sp. zg-Y844]|uniref:hypothetical protein n=1 Tax=Arthrobacter sp. zg-Y844 TaxID=2964612 RepID=UPI002106951E|nr:hypothetical protein [Arthrobacter sp. zg-Y844]